LNQPIAAAITSANACLRWLTRNPPDLERARAATIRIEKDGGRAAEIIQRLRAFYKTGAPPHRELIDINEIVREMLMLLHNEAVGHSISLRNQRIKIRETRACESSERYLLIDPDKYYWMSSTQRNPSVPERS